MGETAPIFLLL